MIDAFYILLVTLFGSLAAITLVTSTISATRVKEEIARTRESVDYLDGRINGLRTDLLANDLDVDMFEEEARVLELRSACMTELDQEYTERLLAEREAAENARNA